MDADGSRLWWIFLGVAALTLLQIGIGTTLAAAEEVAPRFKNIAEKKPRLEKLAALLKKKPHCLERTMLAERVLYSTFAVLLLAYAGDALKQSLLQPLPQAVSTVLTFFLLLIIGAFFVGLFGIFLPDRILQKKPDMAENLVERQCGMILGLVYLLLPMTVLLSASAAFLSGSSLREAPESVTEEDILLLVNAGNENGVIEEQQREMINNIFEFDDMPISEVMTHRTEIVAVDIEMRINDVICLARDENYSRMPVYQENIDNIIGVLNTKDLLGLVGCQDISGFHVRHFMRDALFVPETAKCDDVLSEMSRKKMQMAIVADEYGGTAGVVCMEDILEEIVGNIQDEYDEEELDVRQVTETIYTFDGHADPDEVFPALGLKVPEEMAFGTMSGFVVDLLGRIPEPNETPSVEWNHVRFTVLVMEDNWISKIKAEILPEKSEASEQTEAEKTE